MRGPSCSASAPAAPPNDLDGDISCQRNIAERPSAFHSPVILLHMEKSQLLTLIAEGEHSRLEFKERPGNDIAAVISGFANAGGGRILLGVSDSGQIVGCALKNSERAALSRAARDCDPPVKMDISHLRNENVVVLDVKQSLTKPVQCSKGYFVRENAETRKLEQAEVGTMMRKSFPPVFENMICEKFVYPDDFSSEKFAVWREMSSLSPSLKEEDILRNLGLAEKSRRKLKLTNAAALFFASDPRKFFLHAFITCVLYNGRGKAVIVDRQDFTDGIVADIEAAAKFVKRNMRVAEKIQNRYRTDIYEFPPEAVKEALVNACAHRNWAETGGHVTVEMFPGKMQVISPGGLPAGVTLENIENVSIRRNPMVCDILQRAGLAERVGSGIKKMQKVCQDEGCEPPAFEAEQHYFKAIFTSNPKTKSVSRH